MWLLRNYDKRVIERLNVPPDRHKVPDRTVHWPAYNF